MIYFCEIRLVVTRVEDMLPKDQRKHRLDVYAGDAPVYNVVSSENSQKLTLKLSRTKDEPRGMCGIFNHRIRIWIHSDSRFGLPFQTE